MINKVNLIKKAESITAYWDPKIVGRVNQMMVKMARLKGVFTWHFHKEEDELFYVVSGQLCIELRGGEITLEAGEMVVIPHGVEHRPVAHEECVVMLFEPGTTLNTGNVENEYTQAQLDEI